MAALIEKLRLGKGYFVGNSCGAFVCLLAAQQRPDLMRTLALENSPVVSMFLQALPLKLGELFKLLFSSPGTPGALLKFGRAIDLAMKAFQVAKDGVALDLCVASLAAPRTRRSPDFTRLAYTDRDNVDCHSYL